MSEYEIYTVQHQGRCYTLPGASPLHVALFFRMAMLRPDRVQNAAGESVDTSPEALMRGFHALGIAGRFPLKHSPLWNWIDEQAGRLAACGHMYVDGVPPATKAICVREMEADPFLAQVRQCGYRLGLKARDRSAPRAQASVN